MFLASISLLAQGGEKEDIATIQSTPASITPPIRARSVNASPIAVLNEAFARG